MPFDAVFHIAAVKLMHALGGYSAAFLSGQQNGDFFPRPALLALLPDEWRERFEPAMKSPAAADAFSLRR